jgi:hypothetical protein
MIETEILETTSMCSKLFPTLLLLHLSTLGVVIRDIRHSPEALKTLPRAISPFCLITTLDQFWSDPVRGGRRCVRGGNVLSTSDTIVTTLCWHNSASSSLLWSNWQDNRSNFLSNNAILPLMRGNEGTVLVPRFDRKIFFWLMSNVRKFVPRHRLHAF